MKIHISPHCSPRIRQRDLFILGTSCQLRVVFLLAGAVMAPSYKLIYFNARGKAEHIRFIFAYAGIDYEDERIPQDKWPELKRRECVPIVIHSLCVYVNNLKSKSGPVLICCVIGNLFTQTSSAIDEIRR